MTKKLTNLSHEDRKRIFYNNEEEIKTINLNTNYNYVCDMIHCAYDNDCLMKNGDKEPIIIAQFVQDSKIVKLVCDSLWNYKFKVKIEGEWY